MFVKVCGIRKMEEVEWATILGYSAIGIIVYPESKRFVEKNKALDLLNFAKGKIKTVVVSLYYNDVKPFIKYSDFIQIYDKVNCDNLIFATDKEPENFNGFKYSFI